jgi:hypothetical protein
VLHLTADARVASIAVLGFLANACETGSEPFHVGGADASADASVGGASERCQASPGVDATPSSVSEAVALINDLERPVSLACFLQALERPLGVNATSSPFSLQPAQGTRSPRIFLMLPGLRLSVVPEGPGAPFLEMGEVTEPGRSIKAEIEFPVDRELDETSAYERLAFDGTEVTVCGFCHAAEEPRPGLPNAAASQALRPQPWSIVSLANLRAEHEACESRREDYRCAMLDAIFEHGPVESRPFPETLDQFF